MVESMNMRPEPTRTASFCHDASQWAFNEYTEKGYDVIFATVHGSYLYGTAHEKSDVDFYVVVSGGKGNQKKYEDDTDVIVINVEDFFARFWDGSHQAVEALYSPYAVWNNQSYYLSLLKALRPSWSAFMRKCLSASKSFRERAIEGEKGNPEKLNRHADRLEESAVAMLEGRYTPVYRRFEE